MTLLCTMIPEERLPKLIIGPVRRDRYDKQDDTGCPTVEKIQIDSQSSSKAVKLFMASMNSKGSQTCTLAVPYTE
ncbi:hypothetical protein PROFUN_00899 [Planoprotostelium fungivorum]|uniref:Uncharacterized protein n=1 Tax=Planoprotostelium fungivorum TaxID=1890364 RepID=A0A2P6P095_9EUKA|nr:hypothetical protein PROFUN_00899 [Planoprotostelium fungivorum]